MAINKINLERDGLIVGDTQLVASGGGVYVGNNIAVGGGVYTKDLLVTGNASFLGNVTAVNFIGNVVAIPRIGTVGSGTTITPTAETADQFNVTALAQAATIGNPSGTPVDGQKLIIRLKDNGTGRALTWTTSAGGYRVMGIGLPATTTANKVIYVGCVYNVQDNFWDVVAVATQA
jgi:hypothetical protein